MLKWNALSASVSEFIADEEAEVVFLARISEDPVVM